MNSFYNSVTSLNNQISPIEKSYQQSILLGNIKYSQNWTDNLIWNMDNSGIKKLQINIDDQLSVDLINRFSIVNVKQLIQDAGIQTLSKRKLNLQMVGFRGTSLSQYLSVARNTCNSYIPTGLDCFIDNCQYQLSPLTNQFDLSLDWTYQFEPAWTFNQVITQ